MSKYCLLGISIMVLLLSACAETKVTIVPIPLPQGSSRLRIFVQPVSVTSSGGFFPTTEEKFSARQIMLIEKFLEKSGIYEVVGDDDVQAALGAQEFTRWQLERNDWALARRIGNALHAEYSLIVVRGTTGQGRGFLEYILINSITGKRFGVYSSITGSLPDNERRNLSIALYRELFSDAKADLLATAISKSKRKLTEYTPEVPVSTKTIPAETPGKEIPVIASEPEQKHPIAAMPETTPVKGPQSRKIDLGSLPVEDEPATSGERLVVYDLEVADNLRPIALILSESLREELFKLKRFTLVNRENMLQVMEELNFQQSGLVDEKQAVQLGKGMAASQVITGRFGLFGKSYIMQTKRIEVQSFGTKGMGSLKCEQGREEMLLEQMPELARKLAEVR